MKGGLWATDARTLKPEVWLDVYQMTPVLIEYYGTCQVKNLEAFVDGEPLEHFIICLSQASEDV